MSDIAPLSLLSGVVHLSSALEDWTLLTAASEEARSYRYTVGFEREFSAPPVVQVALVGIDASKEHNLRIRVRTESIGAASFTVVVETWLQSELWSVDVSWLAIGS